MEISVGAQKARSNLENRLELFSYGIPKIESVSPDVDVFTDGRTGASILYTQVNASGIATAYLASQVPLGHPLFTKGSVIEILHNHPGTDFDPLAPATKIISMFSQGNRTENKGPIFTFQARPVRGVGDSANIVPGTFFGGFVFLKDRIEIIIRGTNFGESDLAVAWGKMTVSTFPAVAQRGLNLNATAKRCNNDGCALRFLAPHGVGREILFS